MALIKSTAIPSGATDYELEQSLRFEDNGDSGGAYLSRTPSSTSNRKTWTYSCWFKRGNLKRCFLWHSTVSGDTGGAFYFGFSANDTLYIGDWHAPQLETSAKYRDPSAWMHIVLAWDTTQATESNRAKVYVNGSQVTLNELSHGGWHGYPPQNDQRSINTQQIHTIGSPHSYANDRDFLDGYLTEVNFIDGTAKAPADFGETGDYGEWKPIEYEGTYGTNGFYLPFKQDYTVEGFSTVVYKGNGANRYIGGVGFQPDFIWFKARNHAHNHTAYDVVRGATKYLIPNEHYAEATDTAAMTSFDNDGFSLGTAIDVNQNGKTYVAWNWDMGTTTTHVGEYSSGNNSVLESWGRANTTYGQSVIEYIGGNPDGTTISNGQHQKVEHRLGAAPDLVIVKNHGAGKNWIVMGNAIAGSTTDWGNNFLKLNEDEAKATNYHCATTVPNNDYFFVGSDNNVNGAGQYHTALCFRDITGYSKFGSYSGTGSDGKTVALGFRPAFLLLKNATAVDYWAMIDNVRGNTTGNTEIWANDAGTETVYDGSAAGDQRITFTNTGFTITDTHGENNTSGETYIYLAFADTREYAYWLDQSGNNNDWTSNNLTESDVSVDSPTNNFCTWNPLNQGDGGSPLGTLSEGNLKIHYNEAGTALCLGTMAPTSGKWYCEFTYIHGNAASDRCAVGIADPDNITVTGNGNSEKMFAATTTESGGLNRLWLTDNVESDNNFPARPSGSIIQFAWDMDAGKFWIGTNNQWSNSSGGNINVSDVVAGNNATVTDSGCVGMTPVTRIGAGGSLTNTHFLNCGQDSSFAGTKTAQGNQDGNSIGDFFYTPPTGFLALCTKNLPDVAVTPSEHFNTVLWTGNDTDNRSITGMGFQPDFHWNKRRNLSASHMLYDSIRGATKVLYSNSTNAEATEGNALQAFESDGFQVGDDGNSNSSSYNFVSWNWKADTTPSKTYAVTVVSDSGNKYRFDGFGTSAVALDLQEGGTYKFDQSHSSNSNHPFRFSTTSNGSHGGGSEYTTGVTTSGTPGNSGAYTQITVASGAATLYYYCTNHSNMGGQANTNSTSGSSSFSGTIQSNNSANVDNGFSIVGWTGTGSNATVGHSLSKSPEMIIIKNRNSSANWPIYHHKNTSAPETDYIKLDTTAATADNSTFWNDTAPTSSVFTIGTDGDVNESGSNMIAYCFHSVDGYSKVGSYTGNGNADGTFVYTGFRVAFVMRKRATGSTGHWNINDNKRIGYNGSGSNGVLYPNGTYTEADTDRVDLLSNGFKVRTTDGDVNASGGSYIYLAFAKTPFKNSNAR